jgi:hypothetical protein
MKKVLLSLLLAIAFVPSAFCQSKATVLNIDTTVCGSFTWDKNGVTYTANTVELFTDGDTAYVLNLTILEPVYDTLEAIPVTFNCTADWNGYNWNTPGEHLATLKTAAGCDSIVKVDLTLLGHDTVSINLIACGSYTAPWGETYTSSVSFTDSAISAVGCDYIASLDLTVNPDVMGDVEEVTADGCSYSWHGLNITEANVTFYDTLASALGCDSVVGITVTAFSGVENDTTTLYGCDEYEFNNITYTESTFVTVHDETITSCDVNHVYHIIIVPTVDTASAVVLDTVGGCSLTWYGQTYTTVDTVVYHLTTTAMGNCDSVAALHITAFSGVDLVTVDTTHCGFFTWKNDEQIRVDTVLFDTVATAGCTTITQINLNIDDLYTTTNQTACYKYETTYKRFNPATGTYGNQSVTFYETGVYTSVPNDPERYGDLAGDPLVSSYQYATECKTVKTINLTINEPALIVDPTVDTTVCDEFKPMFNNNEIYFNHTVDTVLSDTTLGRGANCKIVTGRFNIVVNHKSFAVYPVDTCNSYTWPFNGVTYTSSSSVELKIDSIKNVAGCDSIGRLNLTINYSPDVYIEGKWNLQPGESTVLHAVYTPSEIRGFQWYKNGSAISSAQGGTADSLVVAENANTDIRLKSTSKKGCTTDNWITVTYNEGIDDVEGAQVNIYPNPTSRYLNVECAEGINAVTVYNVNGQQVMNHTANGTTAQLDLGSLAVGTYTLSISTANGMSTRKFIVNK